MREYHIRSALTVQSCQFVFGRGATQRFPQQRATRQQTHKYLSIQASSESISWDATRALHNFINATHCNILVRSASIATVQPSLIQFQFLGGKRKKTHLRTAGRNVKLQHVDTAEFQGKASTSGSSNSI